MNEPGKSDKPVVPMKSAKMDYWDFRQLCIERMEGRGLAKENREQEPPVERASGMKPACSSMSIQQNRPIEA